MDFRPPLAYARRKVMIHRARPRWVMIVSLFVIVPTQVVVLNSREAETCETKERVFRASRFPVWPPYQSKGILEMFPRASSKILTLLILLAASAVCAFGVMAE